MHSNQRSLLYLELDKQTYLDTALMQIVRVFEMGTNRILKKQKSYELAVLEANR